MSALNASLTSKLMGGRYSISNFLMMVVMLSLSKGLSSIGGGRILACQCGSDLTI